MSADALPIPLDQFATALETLPLGNLYAKVLELRNSIAHLQRSNTELKHFAEVAGGDTDCEQAAQENEGVIDRMKRRIGLVKEEVGRRGATWIEPDELELLRPAGDGPLNGQQNGGAESLTRNETDVGLRGEEMQSQPARNTRHRGGRLTDDQLREQLDAQMNEDDEGDEGVHL